MSSLEEASALHQALVNHCRNSAIGSCAWKTLDKCSRKSDENAVSTEFLASVELRRKFEQLGLTEKALDNQYTCCVKDAYRTTLSRPKEETVVSVVLGFLDEQRRLRFLVHAFARCDGTIAGSGLCDPKLLYDDQWHCFKTR